MAKRNSKKNAVSEKELAQAEVFVAEQLAETKKVREPVTLTLPATTKETPLYLITPQMGKKPRWFEKARMTKIEKTEDGLFQITLPYRAAADRGLAEVQKAG